MNENIDLTKILKDCPKGWKFYTPVFGEVEFIGFSREDGDFLFDPIYVGNIDDVHINTDGTYCCFGECIIFPSEEQRDWSKFTAPWYKKEKFDPKTLKPFDKIIVRNEYDEWTCTLFSHINNEPNTRFICVTCESSYIYCIPYNKETKHLIGTKDEVLEYYKYWNE